MATSTQYSQRALDADGDVTFGQGRANYLTGTAAIAQNTQERLMMFFGDYFYALLFGAQYIQLLGSKNPAAQNGLILQTRQLIAGTVGGYQQYGILAINSINAFEDVLTRSLTIEYRATDIYSKTFSGSVSFPLNATG